MKSLMLFPVLVTLIVAGRTVDAQTLPDPQSDTFCQIVQQIMANTELVSTNTVFTDMPEYRHSKPAADPLMTYQVVTYAGQRPIVISCKIKGAAHLRSAHGDDAAGTQQFCPVITRMLWAQAIAELELENLPEAVAAAEAFVIEDNEPYITGRDYLSDFQPSFRGDDGQVHFNSPGLFHDYDSWTSWILPEDFEGQAYCHLPTVAYMKAIATGELEPGVTLTTADDAPVTPN